MNRHVKSLLLTILLIFSYVPQSNPIVWVFAVPAAVSLASHAFNVTATAAAMYLVTKKWKNRKIEALNSGLEDTQPKAPQEPMDIRDLPNEVQHDVEKQLKQKKPNNKPQKSAKAKAKKETAPTKAAKPQPTNPELKINNTTGTTVTPQTAQLATTQAASPTAPKNLTITITNASKKATPISVPESSLTHQAISTGLKPVQGALNTAASTTGTALLSPQALAKMNRAAQTAKAAQAKHMLMRGLKTKAGKGIIAKVVPTKSIAQQILRGLKSVAGKAAEELPKYVIPGLGTAITAYGFYSNVETIKEAWHELRGSNQSSSQNQKLSNHSPNNTSDPNDDENDPNKKLKKAAATGMAAKAANEINKHKNKLATATDTTSTIVHQGSEAILKNGYYEVNGFKFTERYYNYLWKSGRKAPSLAAKAVLENAKTITPDIEKTGFFKYLANGWEMVYNPITKEIWHLQPIK